MNTPPIKAMVWDGPGHPLRMGLFEDTPLDHHQIRIQIGACAICRTDLHILDGDLPLPKTPLILGHQIVGKIVSKGASVSLPLGLRVGVPWLGHSCQHCTFCNSERENLCDRALFTGYDMQGGFSSSCVADANYVIPLPHSWDDTHAAPLLCGGLIGYRAIQLAGRAHHWGFYGFGSSAHLLTQWLSQDGGRVYAFTRPGDFEGQSFAKTMGACWAGSSEEASPVPLDAAIIFAPIGSLVPLALAQVKKGGTVVCAGIHMSPIPMFDYSLLWGERVLRSVANLTRQDGIAFFKLPSVRSIQPHIQVFSLEEANEAIDQIRQGHVVGTAILRP